MPWLELQYIISRPIRERFPIGGEIQSIIFYQRDGVYYQFKDRVNFFGKAGHQNYFLSLLKQRLQTKKFFTSRRVKKKPSYMIMTVYN